MSSLICRKSAVKQIEPIKQLLSAQVWGPTDRIKSLCDKAWSFREQFYNICIKICGHMGTQDSLEHDTGSGRRE